MTIAGNRMPHATLPEAPSRKRFNCFLDDTALIAGLKRSTRDGIKKWINNQSIQIFVPLHTLERLRYLAKQTERPGRISTDAQEAIVWLDEITSASDNPASNHVHLEGAQEVFDSWSEVEKHMLPETLFSMESDLAPEAEDLNDSLADLRLDSLPDNASTSSQDSVAARTASPISAYSAASPSLSSAGAIKDTKAVQPIGHGRSHKKTDSATSSASTDETVTKRTVVPKSLQPFFNHLVWRVNQDGNAPDGMDSYILVTNDALKQQIGQRFGIRCKRLEQLREILAREDRDVRNREQLMKKENAAIAPEMAKSIPHILPPDDAVDADEEDEILFKRQPPKGPQAMASRPVVDPNSFGNRSNFTNTRGRGGFRGRGSPTARQGAFQRPRTPPASRQQPQPIDLTKPIDPNSFARPRASRATGGGSRSRLWEPT